MKSILCILAIYVIGVLMVAWSQTTTQNGYGLIFSKETPHSFGTAPLPCNASVEGWMVAVADSKVDTWGIAVQGGGTFHILAYCDGTQWTVAAR